MSGLNPEMMRDLVVFMVALILSICVHEWGHARIADALGDPLPRAEGRVTLNPLAHIDPLGTLLFPILGFFMMASAGVGLLGWGKPVRVSLSARSITRKISIKTAHMLIAVAGPLLNVAFAIVVSVVYVAFLRLASGPMLNLEKPIRFLISMNIGLAFFNLIPCPPLDGGAVLRGILPRNLEWVSDTLEKWGFVLFFVLVFTPALGIFMIPARLATGWWIGVLRGLAT